MEGDWGEEKESSSQRPPLSLSHYGIHQSTRIRWDYSKGPLSCKDGVWLIWGACGFGGVGWGLASYIWLPHHWNGTPVFFFAEGFAGGEVEGRGGSGFSGERFGRFPNSAFLLSRKLHLCKCALCPLVYCLNSIVDFLWEAHRGLGGQIGTEGGTGLNGLTEEHGVLAGRRYSTGMF